MKIQTAISSWCQFLAVAPDPLRQITSRRGGSAGASPSQVYSRLLAGWCVPDGSNHPAPVCVSAVPLCPRWSCPPVGVPDTGGCRGEFGTICCEKSRIPVSRSCTQTATLWCSVCSQHGPAAQRTAATIFSQFPPHPGVREGLLPPLAWATTLPLALEAHASARAVQHVKGL